MDSISVIGSTVFFPAPLLISGFCPFVAFIIYAICVIRMKKIRKSAKSYVGIYGMLHLDCQY